MLSTLAFIIGVLIGFIFGFETGLTWSKKKTVKKSVTVFFDLSEAVGKSDVIQKGDQYTMFDGTQWVNWRS